MDMCPLPFPSQQIYHFVETRLDSTDFVTEMQALDWIQLLSSMDILIPLDMLLNFFHVALKAINRRQIEGPQTAATTSGERPIGPEPVEIPRARHGARVKIN